MREMLKLVFLRLETQDDRTPLCSVNVAGSMTVGIASIVNSSNGAGRHRVTVARSVVFVGKILRGLYKNSGILASESPCMIAWVDMLSRLRMKILEFLWAWCSFSQWWQWACDSPRGTCGTEAVNYSFRYTGQEQRGRARGASYPGRIRRTQQKKIEKWGGGMRYARINLGGWRGGQEEILLTTYGETVRV
jgi:hypothetical protein